MIRCIAIDDEPLGLVVIGQFCDASPQLQLLKTFTSTTEAARFLRRFPVDLLFLDIQMPQNGIEFYREHGEGRMVIFTTAFSQYAVEGFNVDAVDYLLKPVEKARFDNAVQRAVEYHRFRQQGPGEQKLLFVRSEYRLVRINTADIEYIETMDDYLKIHLPGQKPVLTKMNVKEVLSKLDPREFIRIHRSYVVPLRRVISVRNRHVKLQNAELPIGARFEEEFLKAFAGS